MKKLILLLVLIINIPVFSQSKRTNRIEAMKVAYITRELNLTKEEAERFWPVYNKYDKELHKYKVLEKRRLLNELKEKGGIRALTEKEAREFLNEFHRIQVKRGELEKAKYEELKAILPAKKILLLYRAEEGFKKVLLDKLKNRKPGRQR